MKNTNATKEAAIRVVGFVIACTGGYVFGRLVRTVTDSVVEKHC